MIVFSFGPDLFGLSLGVILFLVIGAMVAGFIDSICGGGGLISIPVLMLGGLNPAQAIAANKLQGAFGALASTHYFYNKKILDWHTMKSMFLGAMAGGALGTLTLNFLGNALLEKILPFLLIAMAIYFMISRDVNDISQKAKISLPMLGCFVVPFVGFYDGFFGPGAGSFYMMALIALAGMSVTKALAYSRALNLTSNMVSLIIFIALGKMVWVAGVAMSIGEVVGVYMGSSLVHRKGVRLVKPLLVTACVCMAFTTYLQGVK
ncbi:TSUP family transporter [Halomonas sp. WWR20]